MLALLLTAFFPVLEFVCFLFLIDFARSGRCTLTAFLRLPYASVINMNINMRQRTLTRQQTSVDVYDSRPSSTL